jgi:hypothetical protein
MDGLGVSIQYPSFPHSIDPHLPRKHIVGTSAMPQILLPLSFVYFFGRVVVILTDSLAQVIPEGTLITISVGIVHRSLEGSGRVEVVTFEAFASWEKQRLLHIYLYFKPEQIKRTVNLWG